MSGRMPGFTCALNFSDARGDSTTTQSPSLMPRAFAVSGWICRAGSGITSRRYGTFRSQEALYTLEVWKSEKIRGYALASSGVARALSGGSLHSGSGLIPISSNVVL